MTSGKEGGKQTLSALFFYCRLRIVFPADLDLPLPFFDELRKNFRPVEVIDALNVRAFAQMDGVKFAAGGAYTAAKTLVRINERRSAAEAAGGFRFDLFFGESPAVIAERTGLRFIFPRYLPR